MKCSDIPDYVVLEYLAQHQGRWTMLFGRTFSTWVEGELVEADVFPKGTPAKLATAKMRQLHKRDLVSGCPCGCRGDFEITDKGLALIGAPRLRPFSGY